MTVLFEKKYLLLRSARRGDGYRLAPFLRQADRAELAVSHQGRDVAALLEAFIASSVQSVFMTVRGEPAVLAGVCPQIHLGVSGCVWMLTGRAVERVPLSFTRLARRQLEEWLQYYPFLYNYIDGRYLQALSFAQRAGGKTGKEIYIHGVKFVEVIFRRNSWEEP